MDIPGALTAEWKMNLKREWDKNFLAQAVSSIKKIQAFYSLSLHLTLSLTRLKGYALHGSFIKSYFKTNVLFCSYIIMLYYYVILYYFDAYKEIILLKF